MIKGKRCSWNPPVLAWRHAWLLETQVLPSFFLVCIISLRRLSATEVTCTCEKWKEGWEWRRRPNSFLHSDLHNYIHALVMQSKAMQLTELNERLIYILKFLIKLSECKCNCIFSVAPSCHPTFLWIILSSKDWGILPGFAWNPLAGERNFSDDWMFCAGTLGALP